MKENKFDEYIKKMAKCSANLFSLISLIFILITLIIPIDFAAKTQTIGVLAFLCVIYSGYRVWRDDVEKIPPENDFKIINKGSSFRPHAFLGDGRIDKSSFVIDFDFINRLDQPILINQPSIISFHIDGELFESKPKSFNFKNPFIYIGYIHFPYSIEKQTRETLRCEIDFSMLVSDRVVFAERLKGLNQYDITIEFEYEFMSTETKTEQLKFNGTFDDFKEEILVFWQENKHFELICKATGTA